MRPDRVGLILRITNHFREDPTLIWSTIEFALDSLGFDTSIRGGVDQQKLRSRTMRCRIDAALIVIALLPAGCGSGIDLPDRSTTSVPPSAPVQTSSAAPPPAPNAPIADVREVRTGATAHLVAVRLARQDGYDQLVLEFTDRVPGYTVGYRPMPAQADASGEEIPLPEATALVQITLTPATAEGWGGDARTYFGPSTVTAGTRTVTEAQAAGDFEAVLTWVVGLRAEVPFRVLVLDGPPRLVVDFQD